MTWELKYEFGWSAFHGHKPIISAHSLAVRLWSALRNRVNGLSLGSLADSGLHRPEVT